MKIAGSWASLLRGVSQQPAEVRQAGQHAEQVNLLSDPVAGLTRRRGTVAQALSLVAVGSNATDSNLMLASSGGYRKLAYTSQGKEYVLLLRERNLDPSHGGRLTKLAPVLCYDMAAMTFVPLAADAVTTATVNSIAASGVSACVNLGRFTVLAIKGQTLTATGQELWNHPNNHFPVFWVRGGAYNRRYQVNVAGGASFFYDTPGPSVAGSGDAISPQNIAQQLVVAARAAGYALDRNGAHVYLDGPTAELSVSDGGDGSLMLGLSRTTDSISKLPLMAIHGHVVKIVTGPNEWFYVEAISKNPAAPLAEVVWRECAGYRQGVASSLVVAVVEGGTLRLGPSNTVSATSPPAFIQSLSGDQKTNPAPAFLRGFPITYLGIFQDRLVVGAGAAVAVSAAGDYFNFFRSSVVTVPQKDPFEMTAMGGEDDTLRSSVSYNRNLVVFGDKRQYSISGQVALTPTSANMSIMTTYSNAADTAPIAAGGQIYYARNREGLVGVHQIQPGAFVDSAESFPTSAQIGDYIKAPATQLEIASGAPSLLMVRSATAPREVAVFSFLDTPNGRKQDAWSKWRFDAKCGNLLGIHNTADGVLLFWLRPTGVNNFMVVADLLPLSPATSNLPFLDSARTLAAISGGTQDVTLSSGLPWSVAFDRPSGRFLIGTALQDRQQLADEYPAEWASPTTLVVGLPFDSYVELTNPITRDKEEVAQLGGRLVITALGLNFKNSSGCNIEIDSGGITNTYSFNGRVLGDTLNAIGSVPVSSTVHTVSVGRGANEYTLRIYARKWFPFTLVGIGWTGQSFNRTPRA